MSFRRPSLTPRSSAGGSASPRVDEYDGASRFPPGFGSVLLEQMKVTAAAAAAAAAESQIVAKAQAAKMAATAAAATKLTPRSRRRTTGAETAVAGCVGEDSKGHAATTVASAEGFLMAKAQAAAAKLTPRARRRTTGAEPVSAGTSDASLARGPEEGDSKATAIRGFKNSLAAAQLAVARGRGGLGNALDWLYDRGAREEMQVPDAPQHPVESNGLAISSEELIEWEAYANSPRRNRPRLNSDGQWPTGGDGRRWGRRAASLQARKDTGCCADKPSSVVCPRGQPAPRWSRTSPENAGPHPDIPLDDSADDEDTPLGPPLPRDAGSWDWPLSRQEKKVRVQMIEDHLYKIDQTRLMRELVGLRRQVRRLSGQQKAEKPCADKPPVPLAQPLQQTDTTSTETHVAKVASSDAAEPMASPQPCTKQTPGSMRDPHEQMREKMERVRQRMESAAA